MQVHKMNMNELAIEVRKVIDKLVCSEIGSYVDTSLAPPEPFRGRGKIKLIVLGQDPTVHDPEYKKKIKVVLLLNQPGGLRRYVGDICNALDIELDDNVYATNLLKNFFTVPPDKMRKENPQFFQKAADHWIPLLKEEIEEFENVPILPLGEPVLNCLTKSPDWTFIRYSWGYEGPAKYRQNFSCIEPEENVLSRVIFPFPHLPGLTHKIYRQQKDGYLVFMKKHINP
jgi:hypothetical protein